MASILRGGVRWANLDPVKGHEQGGQRPVLVLSHDIFNERSGTIVAAAITSRSQNVGFPLAIELRSVRMPRRSWVKIDQVRTLSVERVGARLGRASPEEVSQVVEGLNEIIG